MTSNCLLKLGVACLLVCSAAAQRVDVSVNGGAGTTWGEGSRGGLTSGFGASGTYWTGESIGVGVDYFRLNGKGDDAVHHAVSAKFILQARGKTFRPFVAAGAGWLNSRQGDVFNSPSGSNNSVVGLFEGGVSIHLSEKFFLRPAVRSYIYSGPLITVMPVVSVGMTF